MKTKLFILLVALSFSAAASAQEAKTMYVMKSGSVIYQSSVADIDSIIYKPYDPLSDEGVIINGVKWATRNVAAPGTFADNPEDAGMFYQWNSRVGWSATDPRVNSNGSTSWNSSTPSGTSWAPANDPSPAGWRVPTLAEIETLLDGNKVSQEWTTVNGVSGGRFTDKTSGNSIFLPAAGERYYVDGTLRSVGVHGAYGEYWSSTQNGSLEAYYFLGFFSGSADVDSFWNWNWNYKSFGLSVRPVAEN